MHTSEYSGTDSAPARAWAQVSTRSPENLSDLQSTEKPWDLHRAQAEAVETAYAATEFERYAERMARCADTLGFERVTDQTSGESRLQFHGSRFCRVRFCPVCQWRRVLKLHARFLSALPAIFAGNPRAHWLMLTLTVRNMPVTELRASLGAMNQAWQRLIKRDEFAHNVLGWVRSTEITRSESGEAHPHFHALLMVKPRYFTGDNYVKHARWVELWRDCARLDYSPSVHVEKVKPPKGKETGDAVADLRAAVAETLKYAVKPSDLADADWLEPLTRETRKLRFIATGGKLKTALRELENEAEETLDAEAEKTPGVLLFDWKTQARKYQKRGV